MSKSLDRLALLETFARIAERGSISAAARDLGLSQASASRQLKALEDKLGTQLIRRTTHALSLTAAGENLLRDARGLIADWSALEERHGASERDVAGPLKIVAPIGLGQGPLADIAFRFQTAHPRVGLEWILEDEPIRFSEVGCDCWVKVGPVPDDRLVLRALGRIERLVVAAPSLFDSAAPRRPDDVMRLPCAALAPFEGGRIALTNSAGQRISLAPEVRLSTNNIFALHRAALRGIGIAVMPRWFVAEDLAAGRLVDLLPDWRAATLTLNAAFLPVRYQPRRLMLFLETLAGELATVPGLLPAG